MEQGNPTSSGETPSVPESQGKGVGPAFAGSHGTPVARAAAEHLDGNFPQSAFLASNKFAFVRIADCGACVSSVPVAPESAAPGCSGFSENTWAIEKKKRS